MKDAPFLYIRAKPDGDLVEIAAENGTRPNGGPVADVDLSGEDNIRRNIGVDGNFGEPLAKRDYLSLTSIVPLDSIR